MTKMVVNVLVSAILASVLSLSLVGCSPGGYQQTSDQATGQEPATASGEPSSQDDAEQRKAIDGYVEAERAQLPGFMEDNPGVYTDIRVESTAPDKITYTYVYATQIDPVESSAYFDSQIPAFQDLLDSQVFPAMRSAGIRGTMSASYIYVNADGSTIWQKDFTPA